MEDICEFLIYLTRVTFGKSPDFHPHSEINFYGSNQEYKQSCMIFIEKYWNGIWKNITDIDTTGDQDEREDFIAELGATISLMAPLGFDDDHILTMKFIDLCKKYATIRDQRIK